MEFWEDYVTVACRTRREDKPFLRVEGDSSGSGREEEERERDDAVRKEEKAIRSSTWSGAPPVPYDRSVVVIIIII